MSTNRQDYFKEYVNRNRSKITKQNNLRTLQRKQEAIKLLGGKCTDCGGIFPEPVYDFHHINPEEKEYNPYKTMSMKYDRFLQEIKKCVLLCANCHRIRHYVNNKELNDSTK